MAKIKLTKNELKNQKDSLKMYKRYLPTLVLKKQQLQAEIRAVEMRLHELTDEKNRLDTLFKSWIGVFGETGFFTPDILKITGINTVSGNIAGVSIPIFESAEFKVSEYNLEITPLWLDTAVENLKKVLLCDLEARVVQEQHKNLSRELHITTQRVNLFEKVKIPEAKGNIKKIQIYLGDQQTAAVVRGKIAKRGLARAAQNGGAI
ncbi:MAG: V-type ATP synthase subunit D [Elusimicrobia bacterium]|nr:V-type ATP synthase subunit D [Elusimicrobiota bacterium]